MKKGYIVLIAAAAAAAVVILFSVCSPVLLFLLGISSGVTTGNTARIEIDSYRLCEDKDGEDIIIIRYLLKNEGKEPTALFYEGDFYVYQNGVSLTEYVEDLPKDCDYDLEDQYRNIKGGVEYYAEIAYRLEYPDGDVEVEVNDYGLFDRKKGKVFKLK